MPENDAQEQYEAAMEGEDPVEEPQPAASPVAPVAAPAPHHARQGIPPQTAWGKTKAFLRECVRVFRITKKPDRQEFMTIVKISGAGILLIGAIGFLVHLADVLLFK